MEQRKLPWFNPEIEGNYVIRSCKGDVIQKTDKFGKEKFFYEIDVWPDKASYDANGANGQKHMFSCTFKTHEMLQSQGFRVQFAVGVMKNIRRTYNNKQYNEWMFMLLSSPVPDEAQPVTMTEQPVTTNTQVATPPKGKTLDDFGNLLEDCMVRAYDVFKAIPVEEGGPTLMMEDVRATGISLFITATREGIWPKPTIIEEVNAGVAEQDAPPHTNGDAPPPEHNPDSLPF